MSLIQNGSFENFTATLWTQSGDVQYVPTPVKQSTRAVSLTYAPSVNASISQNISDVVGGNTYKLSFWIASNGSLESLVITIGSSPFLTSVSSTSYVYKEFTYVAPSTPDNPLLITFLKGSGTTVYLDSINFQENIVSNGSFELLPDLTQWTTTNVVINTTDVQQGFQAAQINPSGSLSTTITTVSANNYLLTYWAYASTPTDYTLRIGNLAPTTYTASSPYGFQSIAFAAGTSSITITFTTDASSTVVIDNVFIVSNYVKNGGFANSVIPSPVANWTLINSEAVSTPTHYGERALHMGVNQFLSSSISSSAPLVSGNKYNLLLWVATSSVIPITVDIILSGALKPLPSITVSGSDYTLFTFSFSGGSSAASNVITINSDRDLLVDDVAIINNTDNFSNNEFLSLNIVKWTKSLGNITSFVTDPVYSGYYAARLTSSGFIDQNTIPTIIGQSYTLGFYVNMLGTSASYRVTINGDITNQSFSFPVYKFVSINFVATTTSTALRFTNISGTFYLDNVTLTLAGVCFTGDSRILTKNLLTNKIDEIPAKLVHAKYHQVYSTLSNNFVDICYNIVSGPYNKFILIKKNSLGIDQPNDDLYITSGHVIVLNGVEYKAKSVPGSLMTTIDYEPLYTICTKDRQPILVNNLQVMAYGLEEWMKYSTDKNIKWRDNDK